MSTNPRATPFQVATPDGSGAIHDTPMAGTTAVLVQCGPCQHGIDFTTSQGAHAFAVPFAPPFTMLPSPETYTLPFASTQQMATTFFSDAFQGNVPRVMGFAAPVRDDPSDAAPPELFISSPPGARNVCTSDGRPRGGSAARRPGMRPTRSPLRRCSSCSRWLGAAHTPPPRPAAVSDDVRTTSATVPISPPLDLFGRPRPKRRRTRRPYKPVEIRRWTSGRRRDPTPRPSSASGSSRTRGHRARWRSGKSVIRSRWRRWSSGRWTTKAKAGRVPHGPRRVERARGDLGRERRAPRFHGMGSHGAGRRARADAARRGDSRSPRSTPMDCQR